MSWRQIQWPRPRSSQVDRLYDLEDTVASWAAQMNTMQDAIAELTLRVKDLEVMNNKIIEEQK